MIEMYTLKIADMILNLLVRPKYTTRPSGSENSNVTTNISMDTPIPPTSCPKMLIKFITVIFLL